MTDAFGRVHDYLRLSVTDRCNLGCFYCRPQGGFRPKSGRELLSDLELLRLCRIFAGLGVGKIRLTGGEPLLHPALPELIESLGTIEGVRTLGLTTNGTRLAGCAGELRRAGLNLVNVSLDSLRPERFSRITGRTVGHAAVLEGIRAALEAGFDCVKLNMVVIRGVNDDEVTDFAALARSLPLTVRFIEYMPFTANPWKTDGFVPGEEIRRRIESRFNLTGLEPGPPGGVVSRYWRVEEGPGRLGFISALSGHSCDNCSRLRLTADGALKLCLFSPSVADLRRPLREGAPDEQIARTIRDAMRLKPATHPPAEQLAGLEGRVMTQIGG
ncbi:GTP 3',8-cyclase MoaA [bacterium]|nr:GTP 3',8-cyclase MoaA [bacterium]